MDKQKKTIWVADCVADMRTALTELLVDEGFDAQEVNPGEILNRLNQVNKIEQLPPDLIITNWRNGEHPNLELYPKAAPGEAIIEHMKTSRDLIDIPVLMLADAPSIEKKSFPGMNIKALNIPQRTEDIIAVVNACVSPYAGAVFK